MCMCCDRRQRQEARQPTHLPQLAAEARRAATSDRREETGERRDRHEETGKRETGEREKGEKREGGGGDLVEVEVEVLSGGLDVEGLLGRC